MWHPNALDCMKKMVWLLDLTRAALLDVTGCKWPVCGSPLENLGSRVTKITVVDFICYKKIDLVTTLLLYLLVDK